MAEERLSEKIKKRSWYETYRPKTIDEITLPEWQMKKFRDYAENPQKCPNLIFVGPSGSGKTTMAQILIQKWIKSPEDLMVLNGAGIGIDDIRPDAKDASKGKIYRFAAKTPEKSPFNIVYLEELQNARVQDFYKFFRQAVEVLSEKTIFIVSTNSIAELDQPFVKRFNVYNFNSLPVDYTKQYLHDVLSAENVQFTKEDLEALVKYYYPSVRDMIQIAQQYTIDNILQLDHEVIGLNSRIISLILNLLNTRNINSPEFEELVSVCKNNAHLIDINYISKNLVYQVDSITKLKLSKYTAAMTSRLVPDIAVLALVGEILIDN